MSIDIDNGDTRRFRCECKTASTILLVSRDAHLLVSGANVILGSDRPLSTTTGLQAGGVQSSS
jgi:hypothetical protein